MATVQPSKEEWAQIDEDLRTLYETVTLRIDGYTVTFRLGQVSQFKNAIHVWVNRWFKTEWLINNTDEARRFFPIVSRYACTRSYQKKVVNIFGKREANEMGAFKKIEFYKPYWTSFPALKRHLIANNDHIELIADEDDA